MWYTPSLPRILDLYLGVHCFLSTAFDTLDAESAQILVQMLKLCTHFVPVARNCCSIVAPSFPFTAELLTFSLFLFAHLLVSLERLVHWSSQLNCNCTVTLSFLPCFFLRRCRTPPWPLSLSRLLVQLSICWFNSQCLCISPSLRLLSDSTAERNLCFTKQTSLPLTLNTDAWISENIACWTLFSL